MTSAFAHGKPIAVLGCGLIGQSWSALFTACGFDVLAWDPAPDRLGDVDGTVQKARDQVRGLRRDLPASGAFKLVSTLKEAVTNASWIQENAPESVTLKRDLYTSIEAEADNDVVIASSTSSLTWSELAPGLQHSHRLITAHPFNPPHLMPLVEIFAVDPDVRNAAVAFYKNLGSVPVVLSRDAVGHIANRLASALWREAVHIVAEGIADVTAVDTALVNGPGLRWAIFGAHISYHLGGGAGGIEHYLKHLGPSQERRWATLGRPQLTPDVCDRLIAGVKKEADDRSIAELETERDEQLLRFLAVRQR